MKITTKDLVNKITYNLEDFLNFPNYKKIVKADTFDFYKETAIYRIKKMWNSYVLYEFEGGDIKIYNFISSKFVKNSELNEIDEQYYSSIFDCIDILETIL